jgi:hypothetical protein
MNYQTNGKTLKEGIIGYTANPSPPPASLHLSFFFLDLLFKQKTTNTDNVQAYTDHSLLHRYTQPAPC